MIGVAISTHRRPKLLARALSQWGQHLTPASILVVNHDMTGEGVAVTKNRGIAALMQAGCDHLFLVDDDCWPAAASTVWEPPYTGSPEPHLMHCWGNTRFAGYDLRRGAELSVWTWPRGVMLYVRREVVEKVGGMRTEFGRWGGEHAEWSRRIHNAGFTSHEFQDVAAAETGVWHCEDYTRATPSSVPASVRDDPARVTHRQLLYAKYRRSTEFVPYQ